MGFDNLQKPRKVIIRTFLGGIPILYSEARIFKDGSLKKIKCADKMWDDSRNKWRTWDYKNERWRK